MDEAPVAIRSICKQSVCVDFGVDFGAAGRGSVTFWDASELKPILDVTNPLDGVGDAGSGSAGLGGE
ncbi:hypothetical protein GCM10009096_14180 [Parasphingorhabdus litoris]|uniref:Uncharacterized protein n=1 Tax=Parasphingorhabdus litoris TaxID=394733 RepID=A0ABP3K8Z9_9SPHN